MKSTLPLNVLLFIIISEYHSITNVKTFIFSEWLVNWMPFLFILFLFLKGDLIQSL